MLDWQSIFEPTVLLLEGVVRGTVTFLALLVLMRLVGQRESGGLGITDVLLVVLVADADIATVDRAYLEPNGTISVIRRDREENESPDRPDAL